jgi:hypothetical protein
LRILKYLVTIFSSLFLIAGFINPAAAEEVAPPALLTSQPGLVVNQPPAEVSLGAKFSLNGTIDPVKAGVTILRQTKRVRSGPLLDLLNLKLMVPGICPQLLQLKKQKLLIELLWTEVTNQRVILSQ